MVVKKNNEKVGPGAVTGDGPHIESASADCQEASYPSSTEEPRKVIDAEGKIIALSVDLASAVGVIDAAILQQLSYFLFIAPNEGHWFNGKKWVWNTAKQWHEQLPFLSAKSIANHLVELEERGLIYSRQPGAYDRTKHYAIDYAAVDLALGHETRTDDASPVAGNSVSQVKAMDKPQFGGCTNREDDKKNTHMIIKGKEVISFG